MNVKQHRVVAVAAIMALVLSIAGSVAQAIELDELLNTEKLWDTEASGFISRDRESSFRWTSADKDCARYPGYSNSPKMTLLGLPLLEAQVRFKDGKMVGQDVSFYNRGDKGRISYNDFVALQKKISGKVKEWVKDDGKLHKKRVGGEYQYVKAWVKGDKSCLLKWSFSGNKRDFRAEYINFEIYKFDPKEDPRKKAPFTGKKTQVAQIKDLKENIKKNKDGDVYIDGVPMVDQGQKGYCAVAVTERVLRYYGQDIDQHQLAQIADTTERGTNPVLMIKALKKAGTKFRIKVDDLYEPKFFDSYARSSSYVKKYNRVAKKEGEQQVPENIHPCDFLLMAKPELLTKYRCDKEKSDFNKFKKYIKQNVDRGVPVLWAVMLGIVPEPKLLGQVRGGHLRLIIGYNDKKGELVFTDTWGAGHEFKKFTYEQAWTMTTGLYELEPRKNR